MPAGKSGKSAWGAAKATLHMLATGKNALNLKEPQSRWKFFPPAITTWRASHAPVVEATFDFGSLFFLVQGTLLTQNVEVL